MTISLFVIRNFLACHHALFGLRETLTRMGHTVLEYAFPGNAVQDLAAVAKGMPKISELNKSDVVLACYFEYTQPWLEAIYGLDSWKDLTIPVVARYDESMDRVDLNLPARVPKLKQWAGHHFFPAAQDAETFGGHWLPFGADTSIFHPNGHKFSKSARVCDYCGGWDSMDPDGFCFRNVEKKYDVAFIGSVYPMRRNYLQLLAQQLMDRLVVGNVVIKRADGIDFRASTELLAEEYRATKIFFCLPPMSKLIVQKCFDVMATGTFLMYPALPGTAAKNMEIFEHGKHLAYYEWGFFADNAAQIHHFLTSEKERQSIAQAGCDRVHSHFTLESMLAKMLKRAERTNTCTSMTA